MSAPHIIVSSLPSCIVCQLQIGVVYNPTKNFPEQRDFKFRWCFKQDATIEISAQF